MSCGDVVLACVYVVLSTKSFVSNAPTNRKNQACVGNKCECVCILLPALLRNPRIHQIARHAVIFACVFVYFVTLTLGANASRRLFFTPCAHIFLQIRKFCDECVISKHAQTSDCTFPGYFWLRMRVFFQPQRLLQIHVCVIFDPYAHAISTHA